MQIRIKTAEEFHDGHVTIEIVADDHEEAAQVVNQVRPSELDWAAVRAERDTLRERMTVEMRRANDAESKLAEMKREASVTAVDVDSLRRQLADETKRAEELDRLKKSHVCTARCKPNQHVAFTGNQALQDLGATVRELRELVAQRDKALDQAADSFKISQDLNRGLRAKLEQVRDEVWLEAVSEAMNRHGAPPYVIRLKNTIREVRNLLDE